MKPSAREKRKVSKDHDDPKQVGTNKKNSTSGSKHILLINPALAPTLETPRKGARNRTLKVHEME